MKLYYSPGACSMAVHIAANEANIEIDLRRVDLFTKTIEGGGDFYDVTAKGYVPAIELDNGEVLTEGAAIMQYIADLKPEIGLAPPNGTLARTRLQSALNFVSSELHKNMGPLFNPAALPGTRDYSLEILKRRYEFVNNELAGKDYWMGEQFTVADAYLFAITRAAFMGGAAWEEFANVRLYVECVAARPAVQAALRAEGLA